MSAAAAYILASEAALLPIPPMPPHTLEEQATPPARPDPARAEVHLRFEGLGKTYLTAQGPVHALHNIDLEIRRGEIFGIIGHSGAGKSSLLRTINRLEEATEGQLFIDGQSVATLTNQQLVGLRRRTGMIFQHFNLLSAKTVRENIELPLKVAGIPRSVRRRKVDALLALVGLYGKSEAYPAQLSGGQKQRVGIARALVHDPEILLCDEATSALDPETTQSILRLLREINQHLGLTIVLITHEMAVIRAICDRVVVLDKGRIVEQGSVWNVFGQPNHPTTRTLLAPLQHQLPADLQARLKPQAQWPTDAPILALSFSGQYREPDLAALSTALNGRVRLLDGGIERIQGHALGRLVVSVEASPLTGAELTSKAQHWADHVEMLGYVTTL